MKHPPRNIDQSCFDWQKIILKKTDLPYQSKYLALYLASYMNMNRDFAYPGLRTIERETGMSHPTVLKYMGLLVSEGWIGKQAGTRSETNRYWITFPDGVGKEATYVTSEEKVGSEVTRNNNTNNNTLSKGFKRPSIQEVTDYCQDKGYTIDPETFINHYNSNGWKVGKASMKCWKSACSNWNKREKTNVRPTKSRGDAIQTISLSGN
jgi:hypothetical protein